MSDHATVPYRLVLAHAEDAISLARQGERERAIRLSNATLGMAPHDVNIRHKAGVTLYVAGELEAARAHFLALLEAWPEFPYTLLELGNIASDMGQHADAGMFFARAADAEPSMTLAFTRAGAAYSRAGIPGRALTILERGATAHPGDVGMTLALARCLVFQNRRPDAVPHFAKAVELDPDNEAARREYMQALTETGQYRQVIATYSSVARQSGDRAAQPFFLASAHARLALNFDRAEVLATADARERSNRWFGAGLVLPRLRLAIERQEPFALTRFGDGEGRFVVLTSAASLHGLTERESRAIGDSIWQNWFGRTTAGASPDSLDALRVAFDDAIRHSDLIGLPTLSRLEVDYAHFGYLAALDRHVAATRPESETSYTDAFVNMAIHEATPFFGDLLAGRRFLGMIGPHAGLADQLADRLGIAETKTYVTPAEMRLPDQARVHSTEPHWPEVYTRIMGELRVPYPGAVFVVAAGLLGKVYCARVKELGGIAIDAGSVVDAWAGYNTRPGHYDKLSNWTL